MQRSLKISIILFSVTLFYLSCAESSSHSNSGETASGNKDDYSDTTQGKSLVYTNYKLPLPVEIFKMLKDQNVEFNKGYAFDRRKSNKYFTEEKMALIIGIYSSDLVYTAVYDKTQEVIEYFNVSNELAQKLDIQDGYNSKLINRATNNIDNNDSINRIAREAYWRTCNYLEKNDKTNILPLIILGSWIESVNILARISAIEGNDNKFCKELYIQKENLNNLIVYFKDVESKEEISDFKNTLSAWITKLEFLQSKFEEIKPENINLLQFEQIRTVITQINGFREEIVKD